MPLLCGLLLLLSWRHSFEHPSLNDKLLQWTPSAFLTLDRRVLKLMTRTPLIGK
jgi:hypothetical protein